MGEHKGGQAHQNISAAGMWQRQGSCAAARLGITPNLSCELPACVPAWLPTRMPRQCQLSSPGC
jgi:hypothetical protein